MHNLARTFVSYGFLVLALGAAGACGSDDPETNPSADAGPVGDIDASPVVGDWELLIGGDWEIPAGSEIYRCVRKTVTEDTYITGFKSIGPLGTHHTVLTAGASNVADGISTCNAGTNNSSVIFGSGVGDVEYHFPEGVGVKIPAGQQLLLNLHLFNIADAPLTGTSGSEVIMVAAAEVENEAEAVLMGSVANLSIPTGENTQKGSCTMEKDLTLLTVAPHMHQLGTHMKVEAMRAAGNQVVHDMPYDFYDQKLYVLEPLAMKVGDKIEVSCSYNNTTASTVTFGDSSKEEMCFATMYRYPKQTSNFGYICDDDLPF